MPKLSKKSLSYWASASSIFVFSSAFAQSSVSHEDSTIGEIIVTARRVEERLQDVPISITVFNQAQLSNLNIVIPSDLGTYTPSLAVNQRFGPEKSSYAIRGFVQENATAPSVGVYFADVVAARAQGGTTSGNSVGAGAFMDLQNVQVLKGPQGTLFGRNTTGGAVLLVPNKPTGRFEGNVEGSAGDYDMWRLQGVLNAPLSDRFRVRLAVDRNQRDGYMENHSGIGPDSYNDVNYAAGRLSIVADLTPNLENYLIASYSHSYGNGYGGRIVVCETNPANRTGGKALTSQSACDQLARQNARGDSLLDVDINNPDSLIDIRQWQVINTTTWEASDALRIKNVASYAEFRERDAFSLNGDNFFVTSPPAPAGSSNIGTRFQYISPHPRPGEENAAQRTFTEELQFQGTVGDARFTWQSGGYLEISRPIGWSAGYSGNLLNCTDVENLLCGNPLGVGSVSDSASKTDFTNKGLYAQATYQLIDQLSMTAGVRYTWDEIQAVGEYTRLRPIVTGGFVRTCNDTVRLGTGAVANREQCRETFNEDSEKPTWLIDLDYTPIEDVLVYAKWARGYRQGGINFTNVGLETWGPEKVDSYEMGAKTTFGGAVRGYFNLAGFYNDFTDQQLNVNGISSVPGFAGSQPIVNAGKSRISGVEVDASAKFFDSLRFDVGYTYLDTELKSITVPAIPAGAPYSALVPTAVIGGPLTLSPKNRVTLTGAYSLPLPDSVGELSLGATFVHTDKQAFTQATLPQYRFLPATDLLNLNINWNNVIGRPIDLALFMTNVADKIYNVSVNSSFNSAGFETLNFGAPRMWGVRVKYRFGET